jgi:hypothetical protein
MITKIIVQILIISTAIYFILNNQEFPSAIMGIVEAIFAYRYIYAE